MYKLIAVDMDGTFLDENKEYNIDKFNHLMRLMDQHGVHFTVASGNQYYQLKSFFKGLDSKISYVSENGARVVFEGTELFCAEIGHDDLVKTVDIIKDFDCDMIICGRKAAYILEDADQWWHDYVAIYNHKVQQVKSFDDLLSQDDIYFKFALQFKSVEGKEKAQEVLGDLLPDNLTPVVSADKSIDLIFKSYHKAHGVQMIQEQLGLERSEVIAFGDNGNDVEMVEYAGHGVAVDNSVEALKQVADEVIGNHNNDAVLDYLINYYEAQ